MGWEKGTGFFLPTTDRSEEQSDSELYVKYGGCLQVRLSSFFPKGTYDD